VEGICFDKANNRLLVAIKGKEEDNQFQKGIYAFDLETKKMPVKPVVRIDLQDPVFSRLPNKKLQSIIQPSDIDIHPVTHDIYISDGMRPQILIMDNGGKIKQLLPLNKNEFIQPEGITFTPSGELYIASEGNKQRPGKLIMIDMRNQP
jgi:hypothetical protein